MAEGAPLLREYGVKSSIEGSNPSLSATRPEKCSPPASSPTPVFQESQELGVEPARARAGAPAVRPALTCCYHRYPLMTQGFRLNFTLS